MSPKSKLGIGAGALLLAAAMGLAFLNEAEETAFDSFTSAAPLARVATKSASEPTPTVQPDSPHQSSDASSTEKAEAIQESNDTFRVDAEGNLKLDEQTRLGIESLLALNEPEKIPAAFGELTKNLPPGALRKAEELVDRFKHFSVAQKQSYPSGVAPLSEDDALIQLEGLSALRAAHFGADTAEALYGQEEKLSRELIELMRHEKDQSMTMWEKAEKAQKLHDQLPTVAAIEKKNRESAAATERQDKN